MYRQEASPMRAYERNGRGTTAWREEGRDETEGGKIRTPSYAGRRIAWPEQCSPRPVKRQAIGQPGRRSEGKEGEKGRGAHVVSGRGREGASEGHGLSPVKEQKWSRSDSDARKRGKRDGRALT